MSVALRALDPDLIYVNSRGRVFCGADACSRHHRNDDEVKAVTDAEAQQWFSVLGEPIRCAECKKARRP